MDNNNNLSNEIKNMDLTFDAYLEDLLWLFLSIIGGIIISGIVAGVG